MAERGPLCHSRGIKAVGPANADVMIVGSMPAGEEMRTGTPFSGSEGKLLNAIIKSIGLQRDDIYLTNLLCHYGDPDDPAALAECAPRLRTEIESVRPRVIITLGAQAAYAFTGHEPFTRNKQGKFTLSSVRGQPLWYDQVYGSNHSCRIMPTVHPAAFYHEGGASAIIDVVRDFAKLMPYPYPDLLSWKQDHGHFTWRSNHGYDPNGYNFVTDLEQPLAFDIETGNPDQADELTMDVYREQLLCFAIAQSTHQFGTHAMLFEPEAYKRFLMWYRNHGTETNWLMHYGFFDKQGADKLLGIDMHIARDTLAESYSLDERQGVHKLKTLAREYCGARFWERPVHEYLDNWRDEQKQLAKGNHKSRRTMDDATLVAYEQRLREIDSAGFEVVPMSILGPYNAEDAARTAQLDRVLTPMMEADNVTNLCSFIVEDMNVNAEIARNGITINVDAMDDLTLSWGPRWSELRDELMAVADEMGYVNESGKPFNLASPRQKAVFIYDVLQVEPPVSKKLITPTGQRSTNIKLLNQVKGNDETGWLDKYIAYTHLDHSLGSYVLPMPNFIKDDGRVHATWKPHAARTGRDSYADPPWHQLPKYVEEDEEFQRFVGGDPHGLRRMITVDDYLKASESEYIFLEADFKSGEYYMMAYVSGDANLLADCSSADLHAATAANALFHKPVDEVTKKERRDAKFVNFGISFGMQEDSLAKEHLKTSVAIARDYLRKWRARYNDYVRWAEATKIEAKRNGEIVIEQTERKRRFKLILGEASFHELNQAVNFKPQSLLSDAQKKSRIQLHHELPQYDSRILLTVHDMIAFHVKRVHFQQVCQLVWDVMTQPRFGYPGIPVDMDAGPSWGQSHSVKKENGIWQIAA